ncbi:perlucin-like [Portunus trituberculatus]|uniref:perlucin-like n=1 Tax=Portunus trituberculatus TaxID=210409 RepID=UPI001E1D1E79|nr:perlucin-like [Portunus trituberculatus]
MFPLRPHHLVALLWVLFLFHSGSYNFAKSQTHTEEFIPSKFAEEIMYPRKSYKKFVKYDVPATFEEAKNACKNMKGFLALPLGRQDERDMHKVIGVGFSKCPLSMSPTYWLCAIDITEEGNWVNCKTGKRLKYFNFHKGQPDNYGGSEDCLVTGPYLRWWNDVNCNFTANGYICEFEDS